MREYKIASMMNGSEIARVGIFRTKAKLVFSAVGSGAARFGKNLVRPLAMPDQCGHNRSGEN